MRPVASRFITVLLTVTLLLTVTALISAAPRKRTERSVNSVKREQNDARKSLKETTRRLDVNNRETAAGLARLGELEGELQQTSREIVSLRQTIDSLDTHLRIAADSMALLDTQLQRLKSEYIRALRKMQGTYTNIGITSYIFSSRNFSEAAARYRYIREITQWRKRRKREIADATQQIETQHRHIGALQQSRRSTLTSLASAESQLKEKRDETGRVVEQLRREGSALQATIARDQKRLRSLDSELDRLIAQEQKRQQEAKEKAAREKAAKDKAAKARQSKQPKAQQSQQSKTTKNSEPAKGKQAAPPTQPQLPKSTDPASTSFEANKGRLLFPIRGHYTIVSGFGRHTHPDLPGVVTDNPGIDIAAAAGDAKARSIFEGTVSGVFTQDGFNKVVMIRHGDYISIYANLSAINVKTGDRVKANQDIGTVSADPQRGGKPVLHFELRHERTRLNPLQWVK